jgi:hypothetical protein
MGSTSTHPKECSEKQPSASASRQSLHPIQAGPRWIASRLSAGKGGRLVPDGSCAPQVGFGLAALIIAACLTLGAKYTIYLVRAAEADQRSQDAKAIGAFLRQSNPQVDVYYFSEAGTKSSVVYYAERVVFYLPTSRSRSERTFLLLSEVRPPFAVEVSFFRGRRRRFTWFADGLTWA